MLKQGFILALLGAVFYGIAPIFAKFGVAKVQTLTALSIRTFVIAVTLIVILIASGNIKTFQTVDLKTVLLLAGEGLAAGLIGHFFYLKAVKLWEVSRVVPVTATYPLIAFILAILFLGEKITVTKTAGAILAVSGVILLGL